MAFKAAQVSTVAHRDLHLHLHFSGVLRSKGTMQSAISSRVLPFEPASPVDDAASRRGLFSVHGRVHGRVHVCVVIINCQGGINWGRPGKRRHCAGQSLAE